jgi:predicted tellurium resistance membrane protein TerC
MEHLFTSESIVSFFVLVVLEIVLGIDNVIFVSIIMNRLPKEKQPKARLIWMFTGIFVRCILLMGLSWLLAQKGKEVLGFWGKSFDLSSLVMLAGGLFLIYKTVKKYIC